MNELEEKYQSLLKESETNPDIIGLFWGGARGKSNEFLTEYSDMDIYVVITDDESEELIKKLKGYRKNGIFEIRVLRFSEFIHYADWGSKKDWDRYNFTHNKAIIDKTGEIQKLMDEKGLLPENIKKKIIEDSLDAYLNEIYRSAKYFRDGLNFSAYLDATESLPFLMTALYALEGRIKPYNKYFEWELKNYPLGLLPWSLEEFVADYKHILETGDIKTQEKIFKGIKTLFIGHGFIDSINAWKGYYFVGE